MARIKLAAEVRGLAASLAIARTERDLVEHKHSEARTLAQDVERRVKAGDTARVDSLQAQSQVAQAASGTRQADAALKSLQNQWLALTGLTEPPPLNEALQPSSAMANPDHPVVQAAQVQVQVQVQMQMQVQTARAKLELTEADKRDLVALGVGVTRERATFGAAGETSLRLALKISFGGDNRDGPRIAEARAELVAAQAEADAVIRQTRHELASASAGLDAARRTEATVVERARLGQEVQALVAKSFRQGESGLPTL